MGLEEDPRAIDIETIEVILTEFNQNTCNLRCTKGSPKVPSVWCKILVIWCKNFNV